MSRTWNSVELNRENAEKLRAFLKTEGIRYSPSSCYNLIHFEIEVNEEEFNKVEDFLKTL